MEVWTSDDDLPRRVTLQSSLAHLPRKMSEYFRKEIESLVRHRIDPRRITIGEAVRETKNVTGGSMDVWSAFVDAIRPLGWSRVSGGLVPKLRDVDIVHGGTFVTQRLNDLRLSYAVEIARSRGLRGSDGESGYRLASEADDRLWAGWVNWERPDVMAVRMLARREFQTVPPAGDWKLRLRNLSDDLLWEMNRVRYNVAPLDRGYMMASLRATYEMTQEILRQKGIRRMRLYRAVLAEHEMLHGMRKIEYSDGFVRLPDVQILKQPMQSFSLLAKVANEWNWPDDNRRVVIAATVPAEAIVSLPCYGADRYGEQEVVVLGVPWESWSAWLGKAPTSEEGRSARRGREAYHAA